MRTPLYDRHINLKGHMLPFAGWDMPIYYDSIIKEHDAVRSKVGIFDVSHMGRIEISGPETSKMIDYLSTNIIQEKEGSITYTLLLNDQGGTQDDTLIYKVNDEKYYLVANASRRESDLNYVKTAAKNFNVSVKGYREGEMILAIQGPESFEIVEKFFPKISTLKHHTFFVENDLMVASSGYTGEKGFEIFCSPEIGIDIWDKSLKAGAVPTGLGARDLLRLEKGYALYGHELKEDTSPLKSVAGWAIKDKPFYGKDKLKEGYFGYGVELETRAIPREDFPVFTNEKIGFVTSGGYSPILKKGIALIFSKLPLNQGSQVFIEIRNKQEKGKVVKLPFI